MSLVVTKEPADIAFAGDAMYVELFSQRIDRDQIANISISISGSLAEGDTFNLIWNNYELNFVALQTDPDDGLRLPLQGSLSDSQYRAIIISVFNRNATFRRFWVATEEGTAVVLTYRSTDELTPVVEGSAPNFNTSITPSTGPVDVENYAAHILTTEVTDDGENDLLRDESPFDISTSRTYFDISEAFNLTPHLPDLTSFVPFGEYQYGEATSAFAEYNFYYAEKFGSPAEIKKLIPRNTKTVIHGSLAADTLEQFFSVSATKDLICHDYLSTKIISPNKVEWLYIFTQQNRGDVYPNAVITYDDGTTEIRQPSASRQVINLENDKLYWIASGLRQMGITTNVNKNAIGYRFRLSNSALTLHYTSVEYRFDNRCLPNDRMLLVENGLGGCETVRLVGKQSEGYQSTKENLQIVRTPEWTISDGDIQSYNHRGQRTYTINTGWMDDRDQAERLRQLLLGQVWFVDEKNYRFIRLNVKSTSIQPLKKDDEFLFFVSLQVESSALDKNYSSY